MIHRLDPHTKLLMTVLYLVALFVANSWVSYGLVLAFLITAVSLSRIRPKTLLRGMKPIVIIVVLTAVLNLFYTGGGSCAGPVLGHYHYLGGSPDGDFYGFPNHHAHYRHLPADLYHLSHCPD